MAMVVPKCWPQKAVLDMKTHEAPESEGSS